MEERYITILYSNIFVFKRIRCDAHKKTLHGFYESLGYHDVIKIKEKIKYFIKEHGIVSPLYFN